MYNALILFPVRIEIIVLVIVNLFVYKSLIGLIFSPERLNKYFINILDKRDSTLEEH